MIRDSDRPGADELDLQHWHQRVAEAFAPAEVSPEQTSFSGRMRTFDFASLSISHIEATSHMLERTRRHIGSHAESTYVLCLQLEGNGVVVQDGNSARLGPGDVTIYNTSRPYSFAFDGYTRNLGVVIPRDVLSLSPRLLDELSACRMDGDHAAASATLCAIAEYERGIRNVARAIRPRVERTVVSLFETLCMSQSTLPGSRAGERAELWETIVDYIDDHLAEPGLNPEQIAAAHFLSVRSLHSLAQEAGSTIAGWIRHRRLEACGVDLVDPLLDHLPVAEIGARRGMTNPSHFTTLFRQAYGMTPGAYRRAGSAH